MDRSGKSIALPDGFLVHSGISRAQPCLIRIIIAAGAPLLQHHDRLRQQLRLTAYEEFPPSQSRPVVDGGHPSLRRLMLGRRIAIRLPLDLQHHRDAVA